MTNLSTTTGLQTMLTFPFKDSRWKEKLLVGSFLGFAGFIVPILPWLFLAGYYALIIRRIIVEGGDPYLPEWQNWAGLLEEGFRLAAVAFVYYLPVILIMLVTLAIFFMPVFGLIAADSSGQELPDSFYWLPLISQFGGMMLIGVAMLAGIVTQLFIQPAICHAVSERQFAAGFRFKEWWPVFRANIWGFILAFILFMALRYAGMFVFQFLYMTIILCLLIPIFLGIDYFYFGLIGSVLYSEAYRVGQQKLQDEIAPFGKDQPEVS